MPEWTSPNGEAATVISIYRYGYSTRSIHNLPRFTHIKPARPFEMHKQSFMTVFHNNPGT